MTTRRLSRAFFLLAVLFLTLSPLEAVEFVYGFKAGDKYRIVATVTEDVYVDRRLTYKAEILTRIAMEVTGVSGGRARQAAIFQSAEKTVTVGGGRAAGTFQWAKDYDSVFEQDKLGYITIDDQYYMPMVRNVPVFPERDLAEGDTWSADAMEVYDFRDNFGITQPYRIPFTANYEYLGERTWKDKTYPAFSISYRIFIEPPAVSGKVYPRRIQEASDQIIYWDEEHGQPAANEEYFRTIIDLSDGQTWEYRGKAEGEVIEAPPMDKEEMAKDIAQDIAGISDASVRITDEGIVISLENIQFAADSAILRPSERPKLDIVAEILMKYPDRDILVGGHTALAGTASARMQLSQERAAAVAEYFISKNVRTPERVVIRGYGAERPVADNRTPEGMAKNRRVEIIILEN
jgi:outer membrane protein OmpA-like peptidoglycan-associated protein